MVVNDPVSSRKQLWSVSFPGGQPKRLTNDLTDYGARIELTKDASKAVLEPPRTFGCYREATPRKQTR